MVAWAEQVKCRGLSEQPNYTRVATKPCNMKLVIGISIFQDKSVIQSIPTYFQNSEPPIICYKYNKPIRNTIFNFSKLVSDLDIHVNTPKS